MYCSSKSIITWFYHYKQLATRFGFTRVQFIFDQHSLTDHHETWHVFFQGEDLYATFVICKSSSDDAIKYDLHYPVIM